VSKSEDMPPGYAGYFDGFLGTNCPGTIAHYCRKDGVGAGGNPYLVSLDPVSDRTPETIIHNAIPEPSRKENEHLGPRFLHMSWRPPVKANGDIQCYTRVPQEVKTKATLEQERRNWWKHELQVSRRELENFG